MELDNFLSTLSPSLRYSVLVHEFAKIISKVEAFRSDNDLVQKVVSKL